MKNPFNILKRIASSDNVLELNGPQVYYKARYIGNTPCMTVKGEGCANKSIANLWYNYSGCRKTLDPTPKIACTSIPNGNQLETQKPTSTKKSTKPLDTCRDSAVSLNRVDEAKSSPAATYLLSQDKLLSKVDRTLPTPVRPKDIDNGAYPRVRLHLSSLGIELRPEPTKNWLLNETQNSGDSANRIFEYKARRILHATAHPDFPGLFAWVYRHNDGKRNKPECRCHAILLLPQTVVSNTLASRVSLPLSPSNLLLSRTLSDCVPSREIANNDCPITLLKWNEDSRDTKPYPNHPLTRLNSWDATDSLQQATSFVRKRALFGAKHHSLSFQSGTCDEDVISLIDPATTLYLCAEALAAQVNQMLCTALKEYRKERLLRQRHRLFCETLAEKQIGPQTFNDVTESQVVTPKYDLMPKRRETLLGEMVKVFKEKNFHSYNGYRDKSSATFKGTNRGGNGMNHLAVPFRKSFKKTCSRSVSKMPLAISYEVSGDEEEETCTSLNNVGHVPSTSVTNTTLSLDDNDLKNHGLKTNHGIKGDLMTLSKVGLAFSCNHLFHQQSPSLFRNNKIYYGCHSCQDISKRDHHISDYSIQEKSLYIVGENPTNLGTQNFRDIGNNFLRLTQSSPNLSAIQSNDLPKSEDKSWSTKPTFKSWKTFDKAQMEPPLTTRSYSALEINRPLSSQSGRASEVTKSKLELSSDMYEEDSVVSEESGYIEGTLNSNEASPEPIRNRDYTRNNLNHHSGNETSPNTNVKPLSVSMHSPSSFTKLSFEPTCPKIVSITHL